MSLTLHRAALLATVFAMSLPMTASAEETFYFRTTSGKAIAQPPQDGGAMPPEGGGNTVAPDVLEYAGATAASARVGQATEVALAATGGIPPYSFATTAPGASISGNVLTYAPSSIGSVAIPVTVTDATMTTVPGTIAFETIGNALTLSLAATPVLARIGVPYSRSLTVSGLIGSPAYELLSGPSWIQSPLPGPAVAGTPDQAGQSSFTVRLTDSADGYQRQASGSVDVMGPISLSGLSGIYQATIGHPFTSPNVVVSGPLGTSPQFSLTGPSLPPGLSVQTVSGQRRIGGSATTAGNYTGLAVRMTDALGTDVSTGAFQINVTPAIALALSGTTEVEAGSELAVTVTASNLVGDVSFSLVGTPPAWLSISASENLATLSGTVPAGTHPITLRAVDDRSITSDQNFSVSGSSVLSASTALPIVGTTGSPTLGSGDWATLLYSMHPDRIPDPLWYTHIDSEPRRSTWLQWPFSTSAYVMLTYDFGQPVKADRFQFEIVRSGNSEMRFYIEYSNNGTTWTSVTANSTPNFSNVPSGSSNSGYSLRNYPFGTELTARYWRLNKYTTGSTWPTTVGVIRARLCHAGACAEGP